MTACLSRLCKRRHSPPNAIFGLLFYIHEVFSIGASSSEGTDLWLAPTLPQRSLICRGWKQGKHYIRCSEINITHVAYIRYWVRTGAVSRRSCRIKPNGWIWFSRSDRKRFSPKGRDIDSREQDEQEPPFPHLINCCDPPVRRQAGGWLCHE